MNRVYDKKIKKGSLVHHYSAEFRVVEVERDTVVLRHLKNRVLKKNLLRVPREKVYLAEDASRPKFKMHTSTVGDS